MPFVTRAQILERGTRRRQVEPSAVFGGDLCLQELSRWDWRMAAQMATNPANPDQVFIHLHNAALFAAGVIDPVSNKPLFTFDEVSDFREDAAIWAEINRVADLLRVLSEVGPESLKSGGAAADAGRGDRPRGRQRAKRGAAEGAGADGSDA